MNIDLEKQLLFFKTMIEQNNFVQMNCDRLISCNFWTTKLFWNDPFIEWKDQLNWSTESEQLRWSTENEFWSIKTCFWSTEISCVIWLKFSNELMDLTVACAAQERKKWSTSEIELTVLSCVMYCNHTRVYIYIPRLILVSVYRISISFSFISIYLTFK